VQVNVTNTNESFSTDNFCKDFLLNMTFRVNKSDNILATEEFGDCYKWQDSTAPENTTIFHLTVSSKNAEEELNIEDMKLTEDFGLTITIQCDRTNTTKA